MALGMAIYFLFFFFKQKTTYEMCGRDWSSDVCSSDLFESFRYLAAPAAVATETLETTASIKFILILRACALSAIAAKKVVTSQKVMRRISVDLS